MDGCTYSVDELGWITWMDGRNGMMDTLFNYIPFGDYLNSLLIGSASLIRACVVTMTWVSSYIWRPYAMCTHSVSYWRRWHSVSTSCSYKISSAKWELHRQDRRYVIAAVRIRAKVRTQADYVILYSKVELFVQIKLPTKYVTGTLLCCAVLECHWNTRLKRQLQCRGPFIKWSSCKTIKRETRLPESRLNPPTYSLCHQLNLAQHANLDSCYCALLAEHGGLAVFTKDDWWM